MFQLPCIEVASAGPSVQGLQCFLNQLCREDDLELCETPPTALDRAAKQSILESESAELVPKRPLLGAHLSQKRSDAPLHPLNSSRYGGVISLLILQIVSGPSCH